MVILTVDDLDERRDGYESHGRTSSLGFAV